MSMLPISHERSQWQQVMQPPRAAHHQVPCVALIGHSECPNSRQASTGISLGYRHERPVDGRFAHRFPATQGVAPAGIGRARALVEQPVGLLEIVVRDQRLKLSLARRPLAGAAESTSRRPCRSRPLPRVSTWVQYLPSTADTAAAALQNQNTDRTAPVRDPPILHRFAQTGTASGSTSFSFFSLVSTICDPLTSSRSDFTSITAFWNSPDQAGPRVRAFARRAPFSTCVPPILVDAYAPVGEPFAVAHLCNPRTPCASFLSGEGAATRLVSGPSLQVRTSGTSREPATRGLRTLQTPHSTSPGLGACQAMGGGGGMCTRSYAPEQCQIDARRETRGARGLKARRGPHR
ncbi:hypothetical protein C8Q77DRAFT_744084 [Trametes polyzona]|nr:hypothetical protein C8Q77DRAFT_744084 [Trametes polyzona]